MILVLRWASGSGIERLIIGSGLNSLQSLGFWPQQGSSVHICEQHLRLGVSLTVHCESSAPEFFAWTYRCSVFVLVFVWHLRKVEELVLSLGHVYWCHLSHTSLWSFFYLVTLLLPCKVNNPNCYYQYGGSGFVFMFLLSPSLCPPFLPSLLHSLFPLSPSLFLFSSYIY